MSAAPNTCDYCDKRGVPILPLRYGVVPAGTAAPIAAAATDAALPTAAAHYTRRLLRGGYLYVYDEARDRWDDYFATPDGYFVRLYNTPGVPPVLPAKPFNCPDIGHAAVASCITIPDAKRASVVWIGFSDVQWTTAVRALHSSAAYRARHMRCVNVNAYVASTDRLHVLPIGRVEQDVAEYKLSQSQAKQALAWGPFPVNPRPGRAERLIQECERLAPSKGFAVVLDDPAGIAAEIGQFMQHEFERFTAAPTVRRGLSVSNAIAQIEAAVREQARTAEEQAAEQLAAEQVMNNPLGQWLSASTRERTEALRTVTPAEAQRAEDHEWVKYSAKFNEAAAKQWRSQFDSRLQAFDQQRIAPLAQAHVAWMRSANLASAFECNFDATDPECGLVYAKTLQLCIGSTQDKAACFDLYEQWLGGDLTDKTNLLLRALVLNLDATAKEIQTAASTSLDWRGFPFDQLAGNFGKATERAAVGHADAVGRLVQLVGGPLAKWLSKAVDGKLRSGMVALSLHTGMSFVVVEVVGSKKAFRTALIKALLNASGKTVNENQMRYAVAAQIKRLQLAGVALEGSEKKRFVVMVDPQAAAGMPAGTSAQRATWLANAIRTPEEFEQLKQSHWKARLSNAGAGEAVMRTSIPFVAGLIGALLQYNAMQKLSEDDGKAMSHEAQEATWRLRAGILAFGGTVTEMAGMAMEKLQMFVPRLGRGLNFIGLGLTWIGKSVGAGGALVMAWFDWQKADESAGKGQRGLAWAYRASAGVGVLAAAALLLGWTGVGLVAFAVLMVITLLIELLKDNKLQEWLERCYWGKGPGQRYESVEIELAELKKATA